MRVHSLLVRALIATALTGLACTQYASAEDVKALRGKPSSDQILEALSASGGSAAKGAQPTVRRRGLSLSAEEEPAPAAAPAAPAAQPVSVNSQPAPAAPVAARAQAPAPVQAAAPNRRALDLDIQFQFGSEQLTNDGRDVLDQLASALKSEKLASARQVILEGHADAKGNPSYNQALSFKRAQSARAYLASRHGIPGAKLKAVGKGSSEPADPANPESEVNRRVRVILEM